MVEQQCIFGSQTIAKELLEDARSLMATQLPTDVDSALSLVDSALRLRPHWDEALELKARSLLYLRRFREVMVMLSHHLPTVPQNKEDERENPTSALVTIQTTSKLGFLQETSSKRGLGTLAKRGLETSYKGALETSSKRGLETLSKGDLETLSKGGLSKANKLRWSKLLWRYLVLGQACCHLGMMEESMVLLQSYRKLATMVSQKESNRQREDNFDDSSSSLVSPCDHLVSSLLGAVKFLIRRRAAGVAALEAGLYLEATRLFSKVLDGSRRGSPPQDFVADCYARRARAYFCAGQFVYAVADCNRAYALACTCTYTLMRALRARALLFKSAACFPECLEDLETLLRLTKGEANLNSLRSEIQQVRVRVAARHPANHYTILSLPNHCTKAELEHAFLLLSLKNNPDKATLFIERCEFVDECDIASVRDKAFSAANRLFDLIQRAYAEISAKFDTLSCQHS